MLIIFSPNTIFWVQIMTNDELKQALFNKRPVIHNKPPLGEIEYKCVSAIIYRVNKEGKLDISAELTDICGHSVSTADPAQLRYKEE